MRGELTTASSVEEKFEFTNNDMVLGVANYLNTNDHDDIEQIKKSLTPVLLNSVSSTVSYNILIELTAKTLLNLNQGNLDLLKKLQKEGCDLDSIDYLGRSVLHVIACTHNRSEIAEYLCR